MLKKEMFILSGCLPRPFLRSPAWRRFRHGFLAAWCFHTFHSSSFETTCSGHATPLWSSGSRLYAQFANHGTFSFNEQEWSASCLLLFGPQSGKWWVRTEVQSVLRSHVWEKWGTISSMPNLLESSSSFPKPCLFFFLILHSPVPVLFQHWCSTAWLSLIRGDDIFMTS